MSVSPHEANSDRSASDLFVAEPSPITDAPSHHPNIRLVASVEPSVVFTSLAAQCVPSFCDECSVDLVDRSASGSAARSRVSHPPLPFGSGGVDRMTARAAIQSDHVVRVRFFIGEAPPRTETPPVAGVPTGSAFQGEAVFLWNRRAATRVDRVAAEALVAQAVQLVDQQRSEQAAVAATSAVRNLTIALQNSRQIGMAMGVLMSALRITQDEAFEALRIASQRSNRKLRDVAQDVVDTGELDLSLLK